MTNVELRLDLPGGVTVDTIGAGGTRDAGTGEIVWSLAGLAAGEAIHREVAVTVAAGASDGGILTARAELRHDGGPEVDASSEKTVTVALAAPLSAATSSSAEDMVSIHKTSTPPAASPAACSANAWVAASAVKSPSGARISPVGPMEPAITTGRS